MPNHDSKTFHETLSIIGASFSADERSLLISSDDTGVFNVFSQPIDGSARVQLSDSKTDAYIAESFFPADGRVLLRHDHEGDELNHIYVESPDGTIRDLTQGRQRASFLGWKDDGSVFWLLSNQRDPHFFDLWEYRTDNYARTLLFENLKGWQIEGISPDGRWIALQRTVDNADSEIYLWDRSNPKEEPVEITPHSGKVQHEVLTFTPDSRELCYTTDAHGEFAEAWAYSPLTGNRRLVTKADWDVTFVVFSPQHRYRVTGINRDGTTVVEIIDRTSGEPVALPPDLPDGGIEGVCFSKSERWMAFYLTHDNAPSDLFLVDLVENRARQLTRALAPSIDSRDLVPGQVVRYPSFDGLHIPAILYRPRAASARRPVPALVWVHGGPGGQNRRIYRAELQHLVDNGYAVLAVNNRGSSGYGKTFFHLDDRRHGEVDLQDCVWGRRYLASLPWIDQERIGIIGLSYGGFLATAALTFEPDEFQVGIDIFGVTNWLRTLSSVPSWWSSYRDGIYSEMGDPEEDRERLIRISPLYHAGSIRKPLLVVQGANDPRVPKVESDELVQAVRKNGIPVKYLVFPDEGHGFKKKENRIKASETYLDFLETYLRGKSGRDSVGAHLVPGSESRQLRA